jgi:hypothetical protein
MHHEVQKLRDVGFEGVALGLFVLNVSHGRLSPADENGQKDGSGRRKVKAGKGTR